MTDLQISLIAIGVTIVAGVVAYNKWHEIRARRSVERAFSMEQDDVLMKPEPGAPTTDRQEPVFEEQDFPVMPEPLEAGDFLPKTTSTAQGGVASDLLVDDEIDCVIPVLLDAPVRGEKLLPLLQTLRHVGSKPVQYIGLVAAASPSADAQWREIAHGVVYTELQAGVQLANRSGALNELEYSEMVVRLRQIADELGTEADIPDMSTVMNLARSVYQFVSQHDARLGLNIRTNGAPWEISTLLAALERQGFDVRPDGRFVMLDSEGTMLFSLTTNEPVTAEYTPCLTLLLDVPCVAPQKDGFGAMVACAKLLVKRLDGTIVDDGNLVLSDAAIEEIAGQVNAFYQDMQAAGIPAGSHRALRLFA